MVVSTAIDNGDIASQLLGLPGVVEAVRLAPDLVAVATDGPVDDLARQPGVLAVEEDLLLGVAATPSGPHPAPQASSPIAAPGPSDPRDTRRTLVAVIDTGFDRASDDLTGSWWLNDDICGNGIDDDTNGFVDDCQGWDFGADDPDPSPEQSQSFADHGTEVASVIAAAPNGTGVVGVAPATIIMPLKVSRPTGPIAMSGVAAAIDYAVDNGAQVINLSLVTLPGLDRSKVRILEASIDRAGTAGVLVIVGAGNDGHDLVLAPTWPASLGIDRQHVLTVGAFDSAGVRERFSNQGRAVTFGAAGSEVPTSSCAAGTALRSGTSFAAAIVTGVVSTVLATSPAPLEPAAVLAAVAGRSKLVGDVHVITATSLVEHEGTSIDEDTTPVGSCTAPEG